MGETEVKLGGNLFRFFTEVLVKVGLELLI